MIETGNLRRGVVIEYENAIYRLEDVKHIKMGRGGAVVRLKLRHVQDGHIIDRTCDAGARFPRIRLEQRQAQFLYREDGVFHFMDTESYDEILVDAALLDNAVNYLKDGATVELEMHDERVLDVALPPSIGLEVTDTAPGVKGDTAAGGTKPATVETGLVVNVPLFVNVGDSIRVDTRTNNYIERVRS